MQNLAGLSRGHSWPCHVGMLTGTRGVHRKQQLACVPGGSGAQTTRGAGVTRRRESKQPNRAESADGF